LRPVTPRSAPPSDRGGSPALLGHTYASGWRREGRAPGSEEWLPYEWPADELEPTKFWLSDLPAKTPLKEHVRLANRLTLPMVRRYLQLVLLRRIGWCPLCRQRVDIATRPRGPSRT